MNPNLTIKQDQAWLNTFNVTVVALKAWVSYTDHVTE
jgi:hypothetical protein